VSQRDAYYELLITFLHWYRDVSRFPSISRLLPKCWVLKAFRELSDAYPALTRFPHSISKLVLLWYEIPIVNKRASLPPQLQGTEREELTRFQETDSILGVINASRRQFMLEVRSGRRPSMDQVHLLLLRSKEIGDRPGCLKAALLLRSLYDERDRDTFRVLKETQCAWWMKAAWLLQWSERSFRWMMK